MQWSMALRFIEIGRVSLKMALIEVTSAGFWKCDPMVGV